MSASKRPASPDAVGEGSSPKISRTGDTSTPDWKDLFDIVIKVLGPEKAIKNDYKPRSKAWLKLGLARGEREMSPITEEEREEVRKSLARMGLAIDTDSSEKTDQVPRTLVDKFDNSDTNKTQLPKASDVDEADKAEEDGDNMSFDDDMDLDDDLDDDDDDDGFDYDDGDSSDFDEFEGLDWIEQIIGSIYSKKPSNKEKPECLGFYVGALIRRSKICEIFHQEIDLPNQETAAMGVELFDRYGRLKKAHKNHPVKSGSGIWGAELDLGDILLIDRVSINEEYRRKGLGQKLVKMVLEKVLTKTNPQSFTAIARTTAVNSQLAAECEGKTEEEKQAIYDREQGVAASFLRSLGFRRIGYTDWFALAGNLQHPCYSLPANQDFDPPKFSPPTIFDKLTKKLANIEGGTTQLETIQKVFGAYQESDEIWKATDAAGDTLLHHAVRYESPECINWILTKYPELAKVRNCYGNTPLEYCEEYLENSRTHGWNQLPKSDKFDGYSDAFVSILKSLRGLDNPSEDECLRIKYGCTCGRCQFGFISPRMHFALLVSAEIQHDLLEHELGDPESFIEFNEENLKYLPPKVRNNLGTNKSMRQGFANLFGYFAACLRDRNHILERNILKKAANAQEWPPTTRNYLERGGTVYAVGAAIFQRATDESTWAGDGEREEIHKDEIQNLPECRNDEEYGFVSRLCGYRRALGTQFISAQGELLEDD
ncbi:hypothetical protein TWF694_003292 [Orbilia ellipsospora]|uniref:N-acetyltransferase domain-containing protein n=1 Tax=Orbilia ellipsospora TaxID=2528407 RepID=A0AAV9X1A2_9PEZI